MTRLARCLPPSAPSRPRDKNDGDCGDFMFMRAPRGRREFLALFTSPSSFLSSFVSDPDPLSLLPPSLIILARRCSGIEATLFEKASRVVSTYKNMRIYRKSPLCLACMHTRRWRGLCPPSPPDVRRPFPSASSTCLLPLAAAFMAGLSLESAREGGERLRLEGGERPRGGPDEVCRLHSPDTGRMKVEAASFLTK